VKVPDIPVDGADPPDVIADPDRLEYVVHCATSLVVISFVLGVSLPFFCNKVNDDAVFLSRTSIKLHMPCRIQGGSIMKALITWILAVCADPRGANKSLKRSALTCMCRFTSRQARAAV
jgi:hypothetical protein